MHNMSNAKTFEVEILGLLGRPIDNACESEPSSLAFAARQLMINRAPEFVA
jgi:hypothetical protein